MNGEHIRALSRPDLTAAVLPFARERYGARLDMPRFEAAVALGAGAGNHARADRRSSGVPLHSRRRARDRRRLLGEGATKRGAADILDAAIAHLESCDWTVDSIDLREAIAALGLKPGKALPVVYAAIEGRTAGLPLFDSVLLLGRDSSLRRLRAARERLAAG